MTKVGRNEPCTCGSGVKFKKCHGSPSSQATQGRRPTIVSIPAKQTLPFVPDKEVDSTVLSSACLRTDRCVFTVEVNSKRYKILQIMFGKDGSLYVNFPYFKHKEGLTSLVKVPANITYPTDVELNPGGKATTHLVKYSHHPDGRAHFSQDGRVRSTVRKQSVPLTDVEEHLFTIKLQGLDGFETVKPNGTKSRSTKRKTINLKFQNIRPQAFKIVGWWYSRADLVGKIQIGAKKPIYECWSRDGKRRGFGVLLANPYRIDRDEFFLMLSFAPIAKFDNQRSASLNFLGGFDPAVVINDFSKETTFLSFTYPVTEIDELAKKIGTIDFRKNQAENLVP